MKNRWIVLGIVGCLIVAAVGYFGATGLIDSLYAYRSPLRQSPPQAAQPLGQPLTRQVVFVLIDGLRLDTSQNAEVMPYLNELRQQAAWATMHSQPPSYSETAYSVLFTGAWPDVSDGPAMNLDYEVIPTWTQDNLFAAAERAGLRTAISGYYWFEKLAPQSAVQAGFYTPGEDQAADREVVDAALPWLGTGEYQLVLIHIDQVDYAGHHEGGAIDPRWDDAARRSDDLLREIAARLDLSQDTLLVLSDHGHIDRGGHGGQDAVALLEPFVLVGAGVRPGAYDDMDMVDVAPTLSVLLGLNLPASTQGRALTEMLALSTEQAAVVQNAQAVQQQLLAQAYAQAIGEGEQPTIEAARAARLAGERWPRLIVALVVMLIPAAIMFWKGSSSGGRTLAWLLGGALLYLVIFNLRYALLDKRTYTLSSVTSPTDLIIYCAVTAAIALVVSWLVVVLGLKALRNGGRLAAETTLAFAFTVLYLLAIPVAVSFVLNGPLVGWTLPEFNSTFLSFLSLVQGLMVAVLGILLTGISALLAVMVKPKAAS